MNKLGSVHSGGKKILPIGKKLCLRMSLEEYRKGDFWRRRRCDYDTPSKYIYLEQRTYAQQIKDAIAEGVEELFFVLDCKGNDFNYIQDFLLNIIRYSRHFGFRGKIIYSVMNEPLEHMTQGEIHYLNRIMSVEKKKYNNVYFAVGEMACNFTDYYESYLDVVYEYDYISFHTDNSCNLNRLIDFLLIFPLGVKLINNEHYAYDGSKKYGYDNVEVVENFRTYTLSMFHYPDIKSVYICMPYHNYYEGKYIFLGLNRVSVPTNRVYETLAWKMLKQYDIKGVDLVKLPELKVGDRRFEVRALQKCLNAEMEAGLKVDGWFGVKTEEKLIQFNQDNFIRYPKKCTYATWYELMQGIKCEIFVGDLLQLLKAIE